MPGNAIVVVGELTGHDGVTREVLREPLRQGMAPRRQLRDAGYRADVLPQVSVAGDGAVLTYGVSALPAATRRPTAGVSGAVHADVVRQRLAAYAVVTSSRGVLLTQLSRQTGRPGLWILPGGGVDPGEHPNDSVVREVWEEAGQHVELGELADVSSSHRVGPGRGDGIEDFHAVRLLFTARCPDPGDPIVHDVGGSTADAAWFRVGDVIDPFAAGYPDGGMAPWALEAVRALAAAS